MRSRPAASIDTPPAPCLFLPRSYGTRNPGATTRPVAVLRQPVVHVTRMLPTQLPGGGRSQGRAGSSARPDGLSAINYLAFCFARLSPFIPVYRGTPGDALPSNMVSAGPTPDPVSLCWRARRLQVGWAWEGRTVKALAAQAVRAGSSCSSSVYGCPVASPAWQDAALPIARGC